eukprot:TRINITY_DN35628_c0_g3_i1.p1 TRINITY_DN35628_c0_g3~~TRINITY_DN35628_c0_g3_i1.p1  ORF type:complete len:251 (-),score=52.61 TRINITY_DN35628_c0_g3_i1:137-889(-)
MAANTIPTDHVIIGDLPGGMDEEGLRVMCIGASLQWCKLTQDKFNPRMKSAIVELASVEEATFLVEHLNGTTPPGLDKPVTVKFKAAGGPGKGANSGGRANWSTGPYSRPGANTSGWQGDGTNGFGGKVGKPSYTAKTMVQDLIKSGGLPGGKWKNDEKTVYVDGLPTDTTDLEVYVIFSAFGALQPGGVRVMMNKDGSSKRFAFVNFQDPSASALAMLTLNGTMLPSGSQLRVTPFTPKEGDSASNGVP